MKEVLTASYQLAEAEDLQQASKLAKHSPPDLVLLDVMLGNIDSVQGLQNGAFPLEKPIILVTGRRGEALRAQIVGKWNVQDFLYKPYTAEDLLSLVEKHLGPKPRPADMRDDLKRNYVEKYDATSTIVCACNAMVDAKRRIGAFAQSEVMVLIRGETGTGKELVAKELHRQSTRCGKPFIPVNCAAIPKALLESELFGYEKGAFTGADTTKPGLFEAADGGIIFLDEIGDMRRSTQAKILRVLQERQVMRLSGKKQIPVDVRLITATHQDLEAAVSAGRFRPDLYYRIKVAEINLPPLRQRGDDVELLIEHFLREAERSMEKSIGISTQALDLLRAYEWPGNVRELEHAIASAVALTPIYGYTIIAEHLDTHIQKYHQIALTSLGDISRAMANTIAGLDMSRLTKNDLEKYTKQFRGLLLDGVLKANDGNQTQAARQLGVGEKFYSQKTGAYQQWLCDMRNVVSTG